MSADQEAERKGRKWDQAEKLKSNPSLPHSYFLQLGPTSKRFHNLPKTILTSGNQVFRYMNRLGTFYIYATAATNVEGSHEAK